MTAAGLLVVLMLSGCGRNDFENDPKPPVPLEATIAISSDEISISPAGFGAGLVNFVIANNSGSEAALKIDGPVQEVSSAIPNNGNTVFKVAMEPGDYRLTVADSQSIAATSILVGPEREPSNNDLLLP